MYTQCVYSVYTYIMPRVNIYIRKDDWEEWQMIDDVPEFITRAIARENLEGKIAARDHIVREGKELGILSNEEDDVTYEDLEPSV